MSTPSWRFALLAVPTTLIAIACSSGNSGGDGSANDGGTSTDEGGTNVGDGSVNPVDGGAASCGSGTTGWIDSIVIDGAPAGVYAGGPLFWTGTDLVAFGGDKNAVVVARYDLTTKQWRRIAASGAPEIARASVVFADGRAFVWGGRGTEKPLATDVVGTGAILDVASETWKPISTTGAPTARTGHVHVWTGTKMIAYGGITNHTTPSYMDDTGGVYDPVTDTWSAMATGPRAFADSPNAWTGTRLVVSGPGNLFVPDLRSAGCYDLATNTWSACAFGDVGHGGEAVGANGAAFGFGGLTGASASTAATANVNRWSFEDGGCTLTTVGAPQPRRSGHSLVWTGSKIILFGGGTAKEQDQGAEIDPETGTWTPLIAGGTPGHRTGHVAVWAGDRMIVWGGPAVRPAGCIYKP